MKPARYPIGIQTFSEIIEKEYIYVDKTGFIPSLTEHVSINRFMDDLYAGNSNL